METKQFLTSSTSRRFVLTVPMRNGNSVKTQSAMAGLSIVLTVPMRNGNLGKLGDFETDSEGSYRTYEEWKRRWRWSWIGDLNVFLPYL